jgi:hypothetical protein
MRILLIAFSLLVLFGACDRVKQTAKDTINKTGETVGNATTEFADGVSEGLDKTYQSILKLSPQLQEQGVRTGKFSVAGTDSSQNNVLTVYLIFAKPFDKEVLVRVLDRNGLEYGRAKLHVAGTPGDAGYYDFVFNKRTQLESKSQFILE